MEQGHQEIKSERTLLAALLLSAPGPIVTGIAAITSHSTTQMADFVRRTAELVASFMSWWVYRKLRRDASIDGAGRERLERLAKLSVGGAMTCSGAALFIIGLLRMFIYKPSGNVTMGLVIAILGLLTNSWFWVRYTALSREQGSPVLAAQRTLYRAKAFVDFCVVSALFAVAIAPTHPATRYVDALGSVIVSIYLLWNGLNMVRQNKARLISVARSNALE